MTAATAAFPTDSGQANTVKAEGRSPFVRLHELLADIQPGKPAINLSVGEPQHPIPPFVGPVLQAHLKMAQNLRRHVSPMSAEDPSNNKSTTKGMGKSEGMGETSER